MFLLIALVVGLLVAIGGTLLLLRSGVTVTKDKFGGETVTASPKRRWLLIPAVWVFGIAIVIFGTGFREVGPGQLGVRTAWGQVQEGVLYSGLNWVNPIWENIVIYDGRVQAYNFEGISAATSDLQEVGVTGQVNFHIDAERADEILRGVGGPEEYAAKVFLRPIDEALKDATPRYDAETIISKRREVGDIALAALNTDMARYGIILDRVTIANLSLNQKFMDAVEAKQVAEQSIQTATNEARATEEKAKGEANAAIARAGGEAERIRLTAQAQADANEEINASLTPNLLQWQTIQKLSDKIRLMLVPSDQGLIFDLKGALDEPAPTQ